jgi:hypothetical protein
LETLIDNDQFASVRAITLFKAVLLRMIEDIRLFAARQKYRWPLLCTGCWDDTR